MRTSIARTVIPKEQLLKEFEDSDGDRAEHCGAIDFETIDSGFIDLDPVCLCCCAESGNVEVSLTKIGKKLAEKKTRVQEEGGGQIGFRFNRPVPLRYRRGTLHAE